ncbi:MAG: phosphoribosylaminoimidazolesuccinocarboxamide synthase [Treponemataceae bacterium]
MELVYKGKTKDVYKLTDDKYRLVFKDDVTGANGVFDPGANHVGLKIKGAGAAALALTKFFYEKLNAEKVPTHFISADLKANTMDVLPAKPFGKGVEVICRYKAVGSFLRRYGLYAKEGDNLDAFVEFTLKDDEREDPPITKDALIMLGIMTAEEYETIVSLTKKIASFVKAELKAKGLELYDIKFEFGRVGKNMQLALIDEISGGNMRAYKDGKHIDPITVEKIMLS